jgi:hypothetical protein
MPFSDEVLVLIEAIHAAPFGGSGRHLCLDPPHLAWTEGEPAGGGEHLTGRTD